MAPRARSEEKKFRNTPKVRNKRNAKLSSWHTLVEINLGLSFSFLVVMCTVWFLIFCVRDLLPVRREIRDVTREFRRLYLLEEYATSLKRRERDTSTNRRGIQWRPFLTGFLCTQMKPFQFGRRWFLWTLYCGRQACARFLKSSQTMLHYFGNADGHTVRHFP